MSKYTIELREIFTPIRFNPPLYTRDEVENWFKDYNLTDYLTNEQINVINTANIWNKDKLAKKIVNHYFMREIGFETIALFKHYAKTTMDEIMEKYLPLIYSASIKYDPLVNVDYTETFKRTAETEGNVDNTGSSNSNSTNTSSSLGINSDTPQGQVSKETILEGKYATSTTGSENESNITDETNTSSNSESNSNTTENYTKNIKGNSGVSATAQKMIEQYRDNIITIDKNIIDELNILFMGLF